MMEMLCLTYTKALQDGCSCVNRQMWNSPQINQYLKNTHFYKVTSS